MSRGRSRASALPVLLALLLVGGCGGESLDTGKGEQQIKADIQAGTGAKAVKVDCPDDVDKKEDENFDCTATVDSQEIRVPVIQKDDNGSVNFNPQLVKTKVAAQQVELRTNRQLEDKSGAKAQCPTVVPLKRGSSFECDVQTPGPDLKATVTQVDDRGNLKYELGR